MILFQKEAIILQCAKQTTLGFYNEHTAPARKKVYLMTASPQALNFFYWTRNDQVFVNRHGKIPIK